MKREIGQFDAGGSADDRARAASHLIATRLCPAFNLVAEKEIAWVFPRSAVETPAPHFPHALGAAEIWGRWCFEAEAPFHAATPADLERALICCGYSPDPGDGSTPDSAACS